MVITGMINHSALVPFANAELNVRYLLGNFSAIKLY